MKRLKNGRIIIPSGETDYVRFGCGNRTLIMIPGVGDGLKTVKGMAVPFAFLYRRLAKHFTVYVFSRRNNIQEGVTTRDMADDLNDALEMLEIRESVTVGVSQGGMIAQWLAINHPDKVSSLILVVTMARPNRTVQDTLCAWIEMAERGDYRSILIDTAERSYSEKKKRHAVPMYRFLGNIGIGRPKDFSRFIIQVKSCLTHDSYEALERIACPALVIGGSDDGILSGEASIEVAERIPECRLKMYQGLSHGLHEEAKDFLDQVIEFGNESDFARNPQGDRG